MGGTNGKVYAVDEGQNPNRNGKSNDYDIIENEELTLTDEPLGKGHIKVTRDGAYSITIWRENDTGAFRNRILELYKRSTTRYPEIYIFNRCYKEKEYVINIDTTSTSSCTFIDTDGKRVDKELFQWKVVLYLLEGNYYIKWNTGNDFPQNVLFEKNVDTYELVYGLPRYLDDDESPKNNSGYGAFWSIKDEFLRHKLWKKQFNYLPIEDNSIMPTKFNVKYIFYMDQILTGVFYYTVTDYIAMDKYKKKSWMDKAWNILFKMMGDNFIEDEKESLQSLAESEVSTALGVLNTTAGVFLTLVLLVLNQDSNDLLPEIANGINDQAKVLSKSMIKRTKYPVILKIGEAITFDPDEGNGGWNTKPIAAARCEKWDLSNKDNPITALGESYYDGNFFCSENNMQDILDLLNDILGNA